MADINLGHATAYGYAKSKGFSGTEEEFAQLMANYGTVGQTATQAAQTATTKASEAASSASNAASSATDAANSAQEAADIVENIIDDTLTQEGKAADAKVTGDEINNLKDDLNTLTTPVYTSWKNGYIDSGIYIQPSIYRLFTPEYLPASTITVGLGAKFRIHVYDEHYSYLGMYENSWITAVTSGDIIKSFSNAAFIRVDFTLSNESTEIDTSAIDTYHLTIKTNNNYFLNKAILKQNGVLYDGVVASGGLNASGLPDPTNTLRLVGAQYLEVQGGVQYRLTVTPNVNNIKTIMSSISFYTADDFMTSRIGNTSWVNGDVNIFTVPVNTKYIRPIFGYIDNSSINYSAIDKIILEENKDFGYIIKTDFSKQNITGQKLGIIALRQSFCIYDNKFYSTDGTAIQVQDNTLAVIDSAILSLGHGNSMQLGHNGCAYVSGWDDQKVYVVDLESLTITETITLPTTGYTTAVVDDLKGIVYIFQRDTYPTTEESYNFIVYDYLGEQILATYKTVPFAAIQACDFINDRIFVVNGGGSPSMPNGFRVYDTNGSILSDYYFPYFTTLEPQGVALDRDTGRFYLSLNNNDLYLIK